MKTFFAVILLADVDAAQYQGYGPGYFFSYEDSDEYDYPIDDSSIEPVCFSRSGRSKGKRHRGGGHGGWGWGDVTDEEINLAVPHFPESHPPVIRVHSKPQHHQGWGWGHGGGEGGFGGGGGGHGHGHGHGNYGHRSGHGGGWWWGGHAGGGGFGGQGVGDLGDSELGDLEGVDMGEV